MKNKNSEFEDLESFWNFTGGDEDEGTPNWKG
jgi:hypothetical protein